MTKNLFYSFFILLIGAQAYADSSNFDKYVCQEYVYKSGQILDRTAVLTKIGDAYELVDEQGQYQAMQAPYVLEIYKGTHWEPELSVKGVVTTEDVHFQFSSADGKTGFNIYLDEMEESSLFEIQGRKLSRIGHFLCR